VATMIGPFRTKPKEVDGEYSASHLEKGADYHDAFQSRPGRALMWDLERDLLRRLLNRVGTRRTLDFASGTGRVAGFIKEIAPTADVHGVDISESMLEVARETYAGIQFHHADGRSAARHLGTGSFGLVTAFRFFANADHPLRESAADQIRDLVEPGGWVIFNNHRNFWSLPYVAARFAGRGGFGAENRRLEGLFTNRGFHVVERHSLGVWPQSEKKSYLAPWSVTRRLEAANLRSMSTRHALGYNMVWLLRKA
jgi:SAM-dependent methyltransferase